jgi:hypothetical protein
MEHKTKAEQLIETLLAELEPGTPRYRALVSARQFKSSWVELGEQLTRVLREGLFRTWGYGSFEDYCAQEIRIRQATAHKLTLAFGYLEKRAPGLLQERAPAQALPDYRAIDLLRQAEEEKGFDAAQCAELRQAVIEEQRGLPAVRKRFREALLTREPESARPHRLQAARQTAQRLLGQLVELPEVAGNLPALLREFVSRLDRETAANGDSET